MSRAKDFIMHDSPDAQWAAMMEKYGFERLNRGAGVRSYCKQYSKSDTMVVTEYLPVTGYAYVWAYRNGQQVLSKGYPWPDAGKKLIDLWIQHYEMDYGLPN